MVATAAPAEKAMAQTSPTGIEGAARLGSVGARSYSHGFTLIEVLVVLTLLVVIAAVLTPVLLPSPARTLHTAAGELVVALRETRRIAQARRQPNRFHVDTEAGRYGNALGGDWRSLPEHSTVELTTARSLTDSAGRGGIAFFPDGSSSGGRLRLGLDGHTAQIDVEWLTGRVILSREAAP